MQATFQPKNERTPRIKRRDIGWGRVATHLVLIIASLTILLPVLWTFRSSLASNDMAYRPADFSFTPTLNNYRELFVEQKFQHNLWNSFWIAVVCATICLVVGSLAAYSIARFRTGGTPFSLTILGTQMLPPVALVIPFYLIVRQTVDIGGYELKMFDRGITLAIIYLSFNLPFVVWILMGFFESIPSDLEEAAQVDGATPFRAFRQVILPLAVPGLMAAGIFAFVLSWNEFLFALILTGRESRTMPVALASLMTSQGNQVGAICAATISMMAPIVVLTWFIQRHLVHGLTFGAVK
ncbi:MAG TPA: carbohydrate ABC transporter permease [Thermomicrobiales bacterium]|jgi:multiple sugar transport system permease protein|nr:carbohydrate ABC transporter permease [Thermomicrobiales bacterium]